MPPIPSSPTPRGWHSRGYIPHFDSPVRIQHVTVHLADSIPKSAIDRIDQMIEAFADQQRTLERRRRLHEWIDAGHGSCILREPQLAQIVEGAFHHFDGERYHLFAWVVMPNHFHVLFQPLGDWSMAQIVASWKKFTATEIKKWLRGDAESGSRGGAGLDNAANAEIRDPGNATLLSCSASESAPRANAEIRDPGKSLLWHPEYWDRYIRNEKHFHEVIDYIEQNPIKATLCTSPKQWPFSSAYQS
ncbi:transposase [Coraliomargarita sp. W4R53]